MFAGGTAVAVREQSMKRSKNPRRSRAHRARYEREQALYVHGLLDHHWQRSVQEPQQDAVGGYFPGMWPFVDFIPEREGFATSTLGEALPPGSRAYFDGNAVVG